MRKHLRMSIGLAALVAVGCGGSGTYHFTPPSINGTTSTPTATVTAAAPVSVVTDPVTGTPVTQTVPATFTDPDPASPTFGTTVTEPVAVPAGQTIAQGDPTILIPTATFPVPIDTDGTVPSQGTVKPRLANSKPGEVWISTDGGNTYVDSQLKIKNFALQGALGAKYIQISVKNPSFDLWVDGPFHLGSGTNRLDVGIGMSIEFSRLGTFSYPRRVTYAFPANGGVLTQAKINIQFPSIATTSGGGSAEVSYGAVDKTLDATVNSDTLIFNDPKNDTQDQIPAGLNYAQGGGIDYIAFRDRKSVV